MKGFHAVPAALRRWGGGLRYAVRQAMTSRPYGAELWPAFRFFQSAYHRAAERRLRVHLRALRMEMRSQDAFAFDEVVLGGEYDFLRGLFVDEAPSTVLDLGANVGFFAARV